MSRCTFYIFPGGPSPAHQRVGAICLGGGIAGPWIGILLHRQIFLVRHFLFIFYINIFSIYFSWDWKWNVNHCIYLWKMFVSTKLANILSHMCKSSKKYNQEQNYLGEDNKPQFNESWCVHFFNCTLNKIIGPIR